MRVAEPFHLALWPLGDGDLGRWRHCLLTAHVRRYQRHYHSTAHLWQGRHRRRTPTIAGRGARSVRREAWSIVSIPSASPAIGHCPLATVLSPLAT
ncbi:MAG: hypothetical protein ACLQU5_29955 [Isosphaeraceae bacterium]